MRVDELMRHLISGELTNYRVVRTSPEPLHTLSATALSKWLTIIEDVKTTEIEAKYSSSMLKAHLSPLLPYFLSE
jgi:hypothetical protein